MTIRCEPVWELSAGPERFDRSTAIIIPAFNEAPHIARLLRRCSIVRPTLIVIIDDASKDGTSEAIDSMRAELRRQDVELVALRNETNLGKQGSVRRALQWLADINVEAVALIDGDGQHDPAELPAIVGLLEEFDLVIGARSQEEMPLHRQLSNALVNIGFLAIGGVDFMDVQSGLRVYRKELADVLAERLPGTGGYGLEHESLSVLAEYASSSGRVIRAAATPASCAYGEAVSKMKAEDMIGLAYQTVRQAWRIRRASLLQEAA